MEKYNTRDPKSCAFSAKDILGFCVEIAIDSVYNDYNSSIQEMDLISTFDIEV
jgi:hypothetical protein